LTLRFGRDLVVVGAVVVAIGDVALWLFVVHFGVTGPIGLLIPGLLLVGAGQGLCITPLTSTVLGHVTPEHAGAVSGALSTMQQVGNSLGVAITGAVFFAVQHRGYADAFAWSLVELTALLVGVAVLARLLPAHQSNQPSARSRARGGTTAPGCN
jgi:MFS family permease